VSARSFSSTFATALLTTAALAFALPALAQQKVRLATSMGDIVVELDAEKAPKTVDNFVRYVKSGHYNGTVFHRVIDGFMIQAGGMDAKLVEKPTRAPIKLEANNGLSNVRGAVAMARTANPDSATAQFFINVADNPRLDTYGGGYAVFGRVVDGMDVVDRIKATPTQAAGMHQNVPVSPVTILKATLEN
jgi:peptidyl-prolyl cis-trans isomerase A (cyclophilin A)